MWRTSAGVGFKVAISEMMILSLQMKSLKSITLKSDGLWVAILFLPQFWVNSKVYEVVVFFHLAEVPFFDNRGLLVSRVNRRDWGNSWIVRW
ncbi:hypothetical protein LCGC14_0579190 [marine sediment metagenome]|uniref:Uncharacterized protein n=1 Tax=marine sediment metagenome TaxID=412755 RepID=A0A0F9RH33_9ZZZZ